MKRIGVMVVLGMALLASSGCGRREPLKPAAGGSLPPKAASARYTPNAEQLMYPSVEAVPGRSDELLGRSQDRLDDYFDIPPQ